jgi:hypothetical protein
MAIKAELSWFKIEIFFFAVERRMVSNLYLSKINS